MTKKITIDKAFKRNHSCPRGSLIHQTHTILNKQFEKAVGTSRYEDKKLTGHAQLDKIYSKNSWLRHKSAITVFTKYLKEEEGVKNYWGIEKEHVERFLYKMEDEGKRYSTITGYQTAINHILIDRPDHKRYSASELGIEGITERKNNFHGKERPELPDRYKEQMELIRATGLRRSEAEKVGTKSMYRCRDNIYVSTIGKGGRPRVAKVLARSADEFQKRYSDYIINVDSRSDIPSTKEEIEEVYKTQKELYIDKIQTKFATHIYRSIYAQELFKELSETSKYEPEGITFEIVGFSGDIGKFREVSKNLGHNRVTTELMESYLRKE